MPEQSVRPREKDDSHQQIIHTQRKKESLRWRVIGEKLPKLGAKLSSQRLIVRQHQCRTI